VLLIEPPKDIWFVMGEYLPPPYGIIQLAAYLEREVGEAQIKVLDCNAKRMGWNGIAKQIETFHPDIVASSALSTCNTYLAVRTLETAKIIEPNILTVTGGQHFTATTTESLETYPEIDVIVRGEGEQTFTELVRNYDKISSFKKIQGISFRHNGKIHHNAPRSLIENLTDLPYPGYHFVEDLVQKYHFAAMGGRNRPYALIEGSRGCLHRCTFCTQWQHWCGEWRLKSPKRIADEMEYCYNKFGSRFIWLTDDNFGFGDRARKLADELIQRGISEDLMWFLQLRCDDVIKHKRNLPILRKSGLRWIMVGVESPRPSTLKRYKKGIIPDDAVETVNLLKKNDIFSHAMLVIGERKSPRSHLFQEPKFIRKPQKMGGSKITIGHITICLTQSCQQKLYPDKKCKKSFTNAIRIFMAHGNEEYKVSFPLTN